MRQFVVAFAAVLASSVASDAAPPEVPATIQAKSGQPVAVPVKGKDVCYTATFGGSDAFFEELKERAGQRRFMFQAQKPGRYVIVFWENGEREGSYTTVVVDGDPEEVKPDEVKPDEVKPVQTKTFHVIIVYESAQKLTPEQRGSVSGASVEKWLTDNCTGGRDGWSRRDKDVAGSDDPGLLDLWTAVKPKVTVTPCFAVERNGKVDIINIGSTPAQSIEALAKYRKGS